MYWRRSRGRWRDRRRWNNGVRRAAGPSVGPSADPLEIDPNYVPKKGTPAVHSEMGDLYLPLEGVIDVDAEKARLTKELEKIDPESVKRAHTFFPLPTGATSSPNKT